MLTSLVSLVLLYAGLTSTVFKKAVQSHWSILFALVFFVLSGAILHAVPWPEIEFWNGLAYIVEIIAKSTGALLIPPTLAFLALILSLRKKATVDALSASSLRATCIGLISAIIVGIVLKISQLISPVAGVFDSQVTMYGGFLGYLLAAFVCWTSTFFSIKKFDIGRKESKLFDEIWTELAF